MKEEKSQLDPAPDRMGFSPGEFAAMFGRQIVWGYRQIYAGKVKAIQGFGRYIIPRSEIDRILAEATTYGEKK